MNLKSLARTIRFTALTLLSLVIVAACGTGTADDTTTTEEPGPGDPIRITFDFQNGSDGWAADISDFSEDTRPEDALAQTGESPPGIDDESGYFRLGSSNPSDDLFQYMRRLLGEQADLVPNTPYLIEFRVEAASNAPSNCAGIGGAPGESVWLKVGASTIEPVPIKEDGQTRLNVDKGGQSEGGEDAAVAGVIANGIPCEEALDADYPYAMVTWEETLDDPVSTDDEGRLWLFVGVDSGFEGRTDLYYDTVEVVLTPQG